LLAQEAAGLMKAQPEDGNIVNVTPILARRARMDSEVVVDHSYSCSGL